MRCGWYNLYVMFVICCLVVVCCVGMGMVYGSVFVIMYVIIVIVCLIDVGSVSIIRLFLCILSLCSVLVW